MDGVEMIDASRLELELHEVAANLRRVLQVRAHRMGCEMIAVAVAQTGHTCLRFSNEGQWSLRSGESMHHFPVNVVLSAVLAAFGRAQGRSTPLPPGGVAPELQAALIASLIEKMKEAHARVSSLV